MSNYETKQQHLFFRDQWTVYVQTTAVFKNLFLPMQLFNPKGMIFQSDNWSLTCLRQQQNIVIV